MCKKMLQSSYKIILRLYELLQWDRVPLSAIHVVLFLIFILCMKTRCICKD